MDIAQQVQQQLALLAVVAMEGIIHIHHTRTRILPLIQREAVRAEVVVRQRVQSLDGHEQVRQFFYSTSEVQALTPIRQTVENLAARPELRDVFLCHAWDDRQGIAKELHDLLIANGVSVWFSEKDVALGVPLMRAIDKGLANSRIGLVLVTPALLKRLPQEGIADKELSALLARDQLVPIVHNTTYEALREVSPLLASRTGLSTTEDPIKDVAIKLAELVAIEPNLENVCL